MATDNVVVTGGLGPDLGTTFLQSVSGTISMFGTLLTQFILGGTGGETQGGVSIDIDIGID